MKELSIEEKARAYDDALERMKSWVRGDHPECFTEAQKTAEFIFPELKKLDNENIRKKLIKVCEDAINYKTLADYTTSFYKEAIAWLEKQGKEEYALKSFKDEDVRKFMQYIEKEAKAYEFNLPNRGYDIYAFAKDILVWLEKQCEKHKPSIREKYKRIANSEWFKKTHEGMSVSDDEKVNKEEPKFHEGDWIIYNNDICQIVKREEGCNKLVNTFGIEKELVNERNLSTARLWTIQDAKNGDVLVSKHNQPFIYNGIFDEECIGAYCGIDKFGNDFLEDTFSCDWSAKKGVKPATEEQRYILFQKMKEAGYEWNPYKKKLSKIEDEIKIPFSAKDSELQEVTYYIPKGFHAEIDDDKVVIKKTEKPIAWSEEDEEMVKDIIAAIDTLYYHGMVNWLKSLKERVQPQNMWKPSKEQIIALRWVLNNIPYNKHKEEISGLLDQIKVL